MFAIYTYDGSMSWCVIFSHSTNAMDFLILLYSIVTMLGMVLQYMACVPYTYGMSTHDSNHADESAAAAASSVLQ